MTAPKLHEMMQPVLDDLTFEANDLIEAARGLSSWTLAL